MHDKMSEDEKRKPYQKPTVQRVRLVAEEAVLVACKGQLATGPGAANTSCKVRGQLCSIKGT